MSDINVVHGAVLRSGETSNLFKFLDILFIYISYKRKTQ